MLNTAEVGPEEIVEGLARRSRGEMRREQYLWLEQELAVHRPGTYYIVAGHHDLAAFVHRQQHWLRDLLLAHDDVLAYVDGHTHVNAIQPHARGAGAPLWEITGGSTLVYPQLGQLVELLQDASAGHELYLRVRSFRQTLGDSSCAEGPACVGLAGRARSGRNGALADKPTDGDWREESYGVLHSNGILPVGHGDSPIRN